MAGRNEAAERLRIALEAIHETSTDRASRQLAESLLAGFDLPFAAERRATVERIRERLNLLIFGMGWEGIGSQQIRAILDDEAR